MDDPRSEGDLLTIDELAQATGTTVRTTRYYAGLGLLPPPIRRGRVAYYAARHRARLELVHTLRESGFTMSAIERHLARIPAEATAEEIAVQRAMLTSWLPGPLLQLTRAGLDELAGKELDDREMDSLLVSGVLEEQGPDSYLGLPGLQAGLGVLRLDIPLDGVITAGEAIRRHTLALAEELTEILRSQVLAPQRSAPRTEEQAARFSETMEQLHQLTLEAVIGGFRRASHQVIASSLSGAPAEADDR